MLPVALAVINSAIIEVDNREDALRLQRARNDIHILRQVPMLRDRNKKPTAEECVIFNNHMNCRSRGSQYWQVRKEET